MGMDNNVGTVWEGMKVEKGIEGINGVGENKIRLKKMIICSTLTFKECQWLISNDGNVPAYFIIYLLLPICPLPAYVPSSPHSTDICRMVSIC